MRVFLWLFPFLMCQAVLANTLTVTDIKVSMDADTPATAREKAIAEAHKIAFGKIVEESYLGEPAPMPPDDVLSDMVASFSIDKEKAVLGNYTAFFTFHFEEPQLKAWLEKKNVITHLLGNPFSVTATYTTFEDWQHIRKTMEQNGTTIRLLSLSASSAQFHVAPAEDTHFLRQRLEKEGFYSVVEGENWEISPLLTPTSSQP